MIKQLVETLQKEVSATRAFRHVSEVVRHHRIQASPGFREAAEYCRAALEAAGVAAEVAFYPADLKRANWSDRSFLEWEGISGELWVKGPEEYRVSSYAEEKHSLVQRSHSTPSGGVEAELVVVEKADEDASYQGLAVRGKVVMVDRSIRDVKHLAVDVYGAVGIISDFLAEIPPVRNRLDLPDAVQYTSFWWSGRSDDVPCWGFVLSPRQGERLRKLWAKQQQDRGEGRDPVPLKVRAVVESRFYEGTIENAIGFIPGETAEEVIVVAHLCHPQASANDNASGVGVALEVARTLNQLISEGKLARPRRGIRFLLPPEMTGTYAYLAENEATIPNLVAGVNLDMVGEDQAKCRSVFQVEYPPLAQPSFTGDLAARILQEIANEARNLAGTSGLPLFRHALTSFSGGSDHYILSDPTVGVPCPMLIQWPDRYYHTSQDTLDKVDPEMLKRVGVLTAAYAYFIANAGYREAAWLAHEMFARFAGELNRLVQEELERAGGAKAEGRWKVLSLAEARLGFRMERKQADLASLARLAGASDRSRLEEAIAPLRQQMKELTAAARGRLRAAARALGYDTEGQESTLDQWEEKAASRVVERAFRGPWSTRDLFDRLPHRREEWGKFQKEHSQFRGMTVAMYWMDGQRSLLEVADLTELETGSRDVEYLVRYTELLEEAGYVRIRQ